MFPHSVRSEKRFARKLEKATAHHEKLLEMERFSLPIDQGKLAIMHSYGTTVNSEFSADEQKRIFREEAEEVAAGDWAAQYADVSVHPVASNLDMDLALMDREVAGVVLVGHGTIAAYRMLAGEYYNWESATRAVRELKLGHFVQRTCGEFRVPRSVPLGTFVVADRRNLIAPVGVAIDDANPEESVFTQVYPTDQVRAEDIIELRNKYYNPSRKE